MFSTLERHVVAGSGRGSILNPHQILGDLIEGSVPLIWATVVGAAICNEEMKPS